MLDIIRHGFKTKRAEVKSVNKLKKKWKSF